MGIQIRGECDGCHRTRSSLKEKRANDKHSGRQLFLCPTCYADPRKTAEPEWIPLNANNSLAEPEWIPLNANNSLWALVVCLVLAGLAVWLS